MDKKDYVYASVLVLLTAVILKQHSRINKLESESGIIKTIETVKEEVKNK